MAKNKIPSGYITKGSTPVIAEGDEALLFLNPNEVLIEGQADLNKYLKTSPYGSGSYGSENWGNIGGESSDAPSLSDILSVTKTPYYDAVTKLPKFKVVIKIRNSSSNPIGVAGVDARIHNPTNS